MARRLTLREFLDRAKLVHGDKYDYSKSIYIKNNVKVDIFCKDCGSYFSQRPNDHMTGNGCPHCRKLNTKKYIERCSNIHNNFYDYSKTIFKNCQTKVVITCPVHGDFEQRADGHLIGKGCKKCADESYLKDTNYFIEKSNKKHNNFYSYDKSIYITAKDKVIITCPIHGDFKQTPYNHMNGTGCPKCNISIGEREIMKILENNRIKYIHEKMFDKCRGKKNKLPFDFYLPEYNICIEYDGIQHFEPVEYFGGEKTFLRTIECDKIKNEYCSKNNIRLIRIKYDEDINEKLSNLF